MWYCKITNDKQENKFINTYNTSINRLQFSIKLFLEAINLSN